jgi:hypothetical protein
VMSARRMDCDTEAQQLAQICAGVGRDGRNGQRRTEGLGTLLVCPLWNFAWGGQRGLKTCVSLQSAMKEPIVVARADDVIRMRLGSWDGMFWAVFGGIEVKKGNSGRGEILGMRGSKVASLLTRVCVDLWTLNGRVWC